MLVKYPKTMHLPWSPGLQNDDRLIESFDGFVGKDVVVTEKMDGENASLYHDHYHARSLDSRHHPSRDWIKSFHGNIKHLIPPTFRVCGENLYAKHSIHYNDLESYFMGFSVWKEDFCFDWEFSLMFFNSVGIIPVRVWWEGPWEEFLKNHSIFDSMVGDAIEGYVVRVKDGFTASRFHQLVAKFVRQGHIQTDQHWMAAPVVANGLRK